jgi:hypothetical protein
MVETAPNEAVKTDLPSPKPNRRKRTALRFAVLVVGVSALGAAYWFTRPLELVWWRSEPIGRSGRHVSVLIPNGWAATGDPVPGYRDSGVIEEITFAPQSRWPTWLSWLWQPTVDLAANENVVILSNIMYGKGFLAAIKSPGGSSPLVWEDGRMVIATDRQLSVLVDVKMSARNPLAGKISRICDSLIIE